jgi:hypothetical protein
MPVSQKDLDRAIDQALERGDLKTSLEVSELRTEFTQGLADLREEVIKLSGGVKATVDKSILACQKKQSGARKYWFTVIMSLLAFGTSAFTIARDESKPALERSEHVRREKNRSEDSWEEERKTGDSDGSKRVHGGRSNYDR